MSSVTPINAAFEAQRTTIETSRRAIEQGFDLQRRAIESYVSSLDAQKSAQKRSNELTRRAVQAYFDTLDAWLPADAPWVEDLQAAIDDGFEMADELQDESWDSFEALVEENSKAFESISEDGLELIEESLNAFLQAQADIESQAESAAEAVEVDLE